MRRILKGSGALRKRNGGGEDDDEGVRVVLVMVVGKGDIRCAGVDVNNV